MWPKKWSKWLSLWTELLNFSKADTHPDKVELKAVELAPIVRRVIEREGKIATNIHTRIPADVQVIARPELLARALSNLGAKCSALCGKSRSYSNLF